MEIKKTRKKRSDSIEASVEAVAKAKNIVEPPPHLFIPPDVLPFWNAIMKTRANWTESDLTVAAELARVQHEIEYYRRLSGKQTRLRLDDEGKPVISPFHKVLNDLVALEMSLCRTLQVHARATQGESRDQAKRNAAFYDAQEQVQQEQGVGKFIKYRKRIN